MRRGKKTKKKPKKNQKKKTRKKPKKTKKNQKKTEKKPKKKTRKKPKKTKKNRQPKIKKSFFDQTWADVARDIPPQLLIRPPTIFSRASDSPTLSRLLLVTAAPDIHSSWSTLPCATCATLSQLRSGHCSRLHTYRHWLGWVDDDLCPNCRVAPHSTSRVYTFFFYKQ